MAWVLWFTGLPGCGKTTISEQAAKILAKRGIFVKILQLDEIRRIVTPNPSYTDMERDIVYRSLAYMAKILAEAGVNVFIDATANRQQYRDLARKLIPDFGEVFIRAPLFVCMEREAKRKAKFAPRDIYAKAKKENTTVPGVGTPYDEPQHPDILVDTERMSIEECAISIADEIQRKFIKK